VGKLTFTGNVSTSLFAVFLAIEYADLFDEWRRLRFQTITSDKGPGCVFFLDG